MSVQCISKRRVLEVRGTHCADSKLQERGIIARCTQISEPFVLWSKLILFFPGVPERTVAIHDLRHHVHCYLAEFRSGTCPGVRSRDGSVDIHVGYGCLREPGGVLLYPLCRSYQCIFLCVPGGEDTGFLLITYT